VSPELLQATISDSSGDYHYHSVQQEKTDSHAAKIPPGHLLWTGRIFSQYDNGKTRFNEFLKGLDIDKY
jgi:hypothetical protein